MDSKNKEIVDDKNDINDRIIDGAVKNDDRIVNWSKVSADFMSKIKDTYIACKVNDFIFEKCIGKLSLNFNDVSDLILSIATYYDYKIDFYQKNTAMLNKMRMLKSSVDKIPPFAAVSGFGGMGMNPMMGMGMGMNPMMGTGMMSDMMMGMDQNAMMGMNPMVYDVIETLNFLATKSKEISSLNKDISKNLKDKLNDITEDIYKAIQVAAEDKTTKETK